MKLKNLSVRFSYGIFAAVGLCLLLWAAPAQAFWVLNFSSADTLEPGQVLFVGGTGGQLTSVGQPSRTSFTPFLAHAALRVGLVDSLDIGYRMVNVALPWNAVAPTLGGAADIKWRLTPPRGTWEAALVLGGAIAYLEVLGYNRFAWSPGGNIVISRHLTDSATLSFNVRYSYTVIPTALTGGASGNYAHVYGGSLGARFKLNDALAVIPELGLFRMQGSISKVKSNGFGLQYGVVLAAAI